MSLQRYIKNLITRKNMHVFGIEMKKKTRKRPPLRYKKEERGVCIGPGVLWMQRKTKNQIGILCAGVGSNLCEDGDGEGVGDLHVL